MEIAWPTKALSEQLGADDLAILLDQAAIGLGRKESLMQKRLGFLKRVHKLHILLDQDLYKTLLKMADERGVAMGHLVRELIRDESRRKAKA